MNSGVWMQLVPLLTGLLGVLSLINGTGKLTTPAKEGEQFSRIMEVIGAMGSGAVMVIASGVFLVDGGDWELIILFPVVYLMAFGGAMIIQRHANRELPQGDFSSDIGQAQEGGGGIAPSDKNSVSSEDSPEGKSSPEGEVT